MIKNCFLFCFLSFLTLDARIVQVDHINFLSHYTLNDMLIIFDIDNTLIEPTQELGTDQWFYSQIGHYEKQGFSKKNALEQALKEWTAVQSITKVKLVEPEAASTVESVQKGDFLVMGLTTRGLGLAHRTIEQLHSQNIDLSRSSPSKEEVHFMNGDVKPEGVIYREGILFTSGTNKGKALFTLFDKIQYKPKAILFINDKETHLRDVEIACEKHDIPFLGLRYSFLDDKVKNLRRDVADVQFAHFGHILSDDEATELLKLAN